MGKYQSYKPSGVEWIGEIPEHWIKCRLKNISTSVNGYSFKSDDFDREYDIPVIRIGDVGDIIDFEDCVKVKSKFLEEKKDYIIRKDDILIGLTGGTIGKSGRYNYETPSLLNQRVGLLRNKNEVLNGLLYHYVKSEVFIRYIFYDCYGGGQDNISMNDILNMVFPLPPIHEQNQIVQFLDEKTELIDKLISTKEKKITLLKGQRTSLINQVVTKGLNPNVKMKDSGVEWIGEIPEKWLMGKIKFLSEIISKGTTPSTVGGLILDEGPIYYIKMSDFGQHTVNKPKNFIDFKTNELLKRSTLFENDILFVITGEIGRTVIVTKEVIPSNINQNISFIRLKEKNRVQFTWYWLSSDILKNQLKTLYNVSTLPSMSMEDLGNLYIPQPSLSEQYQIVEFLDSKTKEIDEMISLEQKKIELLKEYRQSLISEVVTGKIKVTTD
jgi:type I restriction enzyme, S subunit